MNLILGEITVSGLSEHEILANHSGKYRGFSCRIIMAVVLSLVLFASPSFAAQDAGKVGIVDSGKILRLMPETKQAETTLQATVAPLRKELERMNLDLKKSIAAYQQQKASLASATRMQKEKELTLKAQALQKYQQVNGALVEKKKQALFMPVRQKILTAVMTIAQKDGFSVVFEKSTTLYVSPDHDLTVKVMTLLHLK